MSDERNTGTEKPASSGLGAGGKIAIVAVVAAAVVAVIWLKDREKVPNPVSATGNGQAAVADGKPEVGVQPPQPVAALPRLVDLGAGKCIPCKMMAPILEELKKEYAGRLEVVFIDVWQNPDAGKQYGIKLIPTQIFYGPDGKELFRHEGFFSREDILKKWKEQGFDFATADVSAPAAAELPRIERWEPTAKDERSKDQVCRMCDGDIKARTLVVVKTDKGDVRLCSPHCYFIMYSCLTEDKTGFEKKVAATDWAGGKPVPLADAVWLSGLDEKSGRPVIKAFAGREDAVKEMQAAGGSIVTLEALQKQELANRCGFCDRACYPQDAAAVTCGEVRTLGCCSHCALGVAARTGTDIEVRERDRLTGEPIVVKTAGGKVASLEPKTAVAWFGQKQTAEGKWVSAGCFHQGFFTTPGNLQKWLDSHPLETGKLVSIQQALEDKMKLTPQQIMKACKIGECKP